MAENKKIAVLAMNVLQLANVSNVGAGNTVTVNMPVGGHTYEQILLEHNIANDTDITNIQVRINDKTFQEFRNASILRKHSKYFTRVNSAGIMVFDFDQSQFNTLPQRKSFGIGTADIAKFTIVFTLAATVINPEFKAFAKVGSPTTLGGINIIRERQFSTAVAGKIQISDPFLQGARLLNLHLEKADITSIELKLNQTIVYESKEALNNLLLRQAGRTPQASWFSLDFTTQGAIAQSLVTDPNAIKSVSLNPTITTAGPLNLIQSYWGKLDSA